MLRVFQGSVYRIKLKLPQALKHDLGSFIFAATVRSLRCVVYANGSVRKTRPLQGLLLEIEGMWALLRLLYDLRGISKGEFQVLSGKLSDLGAQANAWLRWEKGRPKAEGERPERADGDSRDARA